MIVDKTAEMEWVNCLLCGSDESRPLHTQRHFPTQQPGRFTLVRCLQCGLVYLNPRPTVDAIGAYYPPTYESHAPLLPEHLPWPQRWLVQYGFWKRCQPLLVGHSRGKVLDVGCGTGHFLAAMKKYGHWETVGIDPSEEAIRFAKEVLHVEAYVGRAEEIHLPDHTFDAVTMWDTLEHLHDPRSALMEVQRILKPRGQLLLRVPSLDSLDAHLFGPHWAGLDIPRHLTVFSRKTLSRLLVETGFTIERLWCMSGSHASFVISLRSHLNHHNQAGGPSHVLLRMAASPVGSVLSAPYFFIIDKLLLGPEITVLARKQAENGGG